ncbi:KAP family P-loop domain-containing protein [Anaerovibrio lipolyticus DSM 3074]|uniref:KAP family P-loop domain-containing protein n=1 Tax=Anaerovibrio lipolyticus DSM 3074 TaxID=1120997 RepID=A0A1M6GPK2_9FIRM|nr:P-loop NTPase fold protein [Anaerovibrio lipolyticus]SHJ11864.1 KAP family P-loop domain-containing protein [Anaerovibrio lipolyticus DSM 3074]
MNNTVDTFDRTKFVEQVLDIVDASKKQENGIAFSVSAGWGYGKTFVLNELESRLKDSDDIVVLHYDCWEYNYYEEPLMAMIASITDQLTQIDNKSKKLSCILIKAAKYMAVDGMTKLGGALSKQVCTVDIIKLCEDAYQSIQGELKDLGLPDFDKSSDLRKSIAIIRAILKKISEEKQLVLIVDEIDRCLPSYQIKVLERIHHITMDQKFITIYGLNPEQLRQTVIQMFGGAGVNDVNRVRAFLKKYMDFHIALPLGTISKNCFQKYSKNLEPFEDVAIFSKQKDFMATLSDLFSECDPRTVEKLWDKQFLIHNLVFTADVFHQNDRKLPLEILTAELLILVMIYWRYTKPPKINGPLGSGPNATVEKMLHGFFRVTNAKENTENNNLLFSELWERIIQNMNATHVSVAGHGDLCTVELPNNRPKFLAAVGAFWCNATGNKYLKYEIGAHHSGGQVDEFYVSNFNKYCDLMQKFYEMACIIE